MKESYEEALKNEAQAKKLKNEKRFSEAANKFKDAANIWKKLRNERNYLWCMANYYFHGGKALLKSKKYEEAYGQFESSEELFRKLGIMKQVTICEVYRYEIKAHVERINHNFANSAKFFFKAGELIADVSVSSRMRYEYEAYISLGFGETRNENYGKAGNYFKLAQAVAEVLKDDQAASWAKAHECECEYYDAKDKWNLKGIIEALRRTVEYYAKTKDHTALYVSKGDLAKYSGLWLKVKKRFKDAASCFDDAYFWYTQALKSDPKHAKRHQFSIRYASALATGTKADIDLLKNDLNSASINYNDAYQKFESCGDEKSAKIYRNLYQLCKFLANDNIKEALPVLNNLSLDFKLPSKKPTSVKEFISLTGLIISSHASEMVKEAIAIDKGPSFEARVRELIRSFDNREVDIGKIGFLPPTIKKLKLNRYENVKRKIFKPKSDEVGIVFKDNTPVEIDILAERTERGRRFLLLVECQHSPSRIFETRELALLMRKAELVKVRYKKLAELYEEREPLIEQKWFVTTGNFSNSAIEFAQSNNILLVGINALNNLLKLFGLPRIK